MEIINVWCVQVGGAKKLIENHLRTDTARSKYVQVIKYIAKIGLHFEIVSVLLSCSVSTALLEFHYFRN